MQKFLGMIHPATGFFKIIRYINKQSSMIENPVKKTGYINTQGLQYLRTIAVMNSLVLNFKVPNQK